MVTVTKHFQREDAEGSPYSMLELTGDMEIMFTQASGRSYATALWFKSSSGRLNLKIKTRTGQ